MVVHAVEKVRHFLSGGLERGLRKVHENVFLTVLRNSGDVFRDVASQVESVFVEHIFKHTFFAVSVE